MRDFNFRWAESIIKFQLVETSLWVLINAFFSSEVKIITQQNDCCFESDNQLH